MVLKEPLGRKIVTAVAARAIGLGAPGRRTRIVRHITEYASPGRPERDSRDDGAARRWTSSLAAAVAAGPLGIVDLLAVSLSWPTSSRLCTSEVVVHRDITPSNIVWSGEPRQPTMIDFDLATTAVEERPGFTHANDIVGDPGLYRP